MSAFKYFTKIDIVKPVKASGGLLSECSVSDLEQRRLKLKHAWQLNWFVLLPTMAGRSQVVQILIWTVVELVASCKGHP